MAGALCANPPLAVEALRRRPFFARQSQHQAVVIAKAARPNRFKPQPLVEADGALIARQGVDQDCVCRRIRKAAFKCQAHHRRAMAFVAVSIAADPDVDGLMARRNIAPIVRFLIARVDDLDKANGPKAIAFGYFCHQQFAPLHVTRHFKRPVEKIVIARGRRNIVVLIPRTEERNVIRPRCAQSHPALAHVSLRL